MHRRSFLKFLGVSGAVAAVPKGAEFFRPTEKSKLPKNMSIEHHRSTPGMTMCSFVTESAKDSWGLDIRSARR